MAVGWWVLALASMDWYSEAIGCQASHITTVPGVLQGQKKTVGHGVYDPSSLVSSYS